MPDLSSPFSAPDQPVTRTGTCPVCGREDLPLVDRRISAHTQMRVTKSGVHDSGEHCDGSGGPPEPGTVSNRWSAKKDPQPHRGNRMRSDVRQRIQGGGR